MRSLFTNRQFDIEPGQTLSGVAQRAQTLRVKQGKVWLTVEGIKHDYWLSAGDSFTAIPGRLIVVQADTASSIDARRPGTRQALQQATAALGALMQRLFGRDTVQATLKRHRACNDAY